MKEKFLIVCSHASLRTAPALSSYFPESALSTLPPKLKSFSIPLFINVSGAESTPADVSLLTSAVGLKVYSIIPKPHFIHSLIFFICLI